MRGSAPSRRPTPKKIGASTTFHVHQRTGEGYLDLIGGLLGERLQIGDPAYGQKGYAVNLDAKALCHEGVAELVQEHADEQRYYSDGVCERSEEATRCLVA